MATERFEFTIKDILPDLITTLSVDSPQIVVHHSVVVSAEVRSLEAPIGTPFQVVFRDGNEIIKTEEIQRLNRDETASIGFPFVIHQRGKHRLTIQVDANNTIAESEESNNIQAVDVQVKEGKLVVRSNPFTPNNDGYNDFVGFDFTEFSLEKPFLKIFDFQGRAIVTLDSFYESKFIWDGKDRRGHDAKPGIYLYILQDSDRHVARGYVVLAR